MVDKRLQDRLLKLERIDQSIRTPPREKWVYSRKMSENDSKKEEWLHAQIRNIVNEYGLPTISRVGKRGETAAWLLIQHCDTDVRFQKRCLNRAREAVKRKDFSPEHMAYLTDRVRVNLGMPQLYGTQFHRNKVGKLIPRPIEDKKGLDARRLAFGMATFEEYRALMLSRSWNMQKKKEKEKKD